MKALLKRGMTDKPDEKKKKKKKKE